jgi:hypothetical protein
MEYWKLRSVEKVYLLVHTSVANVKNKNVSYDELLQQKGNTSNNK